MPGLVAWRSAAHGQLNRSVFKEWTLLDWSGLKVPECAPWEAEYVCSEFQYRARAPLLH